MLKGIFCIITIGFLAISCASSKKSSGVAAPSSDYKEERYPQSAGGIQTRFEEGSKRVYKDVRNSTGENAKALSDRNPFLNFQVNIENSTLLQFKYAVLTGVPVEWLGNLDLLYFMEEWYGTPYRYGGFTRKGIDCSAFTLNFMRSVFNISLPRTVKEQYQQSLRIARSQLQLGDLVFFNTKGRLSHVGVYLFNNKFVHASTSNGVMISDLSEDYFNKRYVGAGKLQP